MAVLLNPFLWLAVTLAVWVLWRLLTRAAGSGRRPRRRRRGTASGFTAAALAGQAVYQPSARQILEAQLRDATNREEDDEGAPPEAGAEQNR